ncbi:MAG: aspartyl protease family protein [Paludibacter sp.]
MRRAFLLTFLFFLLVDTFAANKRKSIASIPFEMVGTYAIVKVKINDSSPLNLILDSGVKNTIITELFSGDNITLYYSSVKDLMGLGSGNHLEAFTSDFNTLKIGRLKIPQKTVYVLKEDVFNLSKHTGTKINGIIGTDFFDNYIVEINYSIKRVRFYEKDSSFLPPKGYGMMPMAIEGRKMFVKLSVLETDSTRRKVKMLIDTGAELNAWFQTFKKQSVHIPKNRIYGVIGQGLNGEIAGAFGRISQICFGDFCLNNVIVSFPDSAAIVDIVTDQERDGTIGSEILSRFNLFIDYSQKQLFFKPNSNFKKPFNYNIAGIEVTQVLPLIPQTEVWRVWENSPAAIAGVQVGDQIIEINGQKAFQMSVGEIKMLMETPSKGTMELTLLRNDKQISVKINMKSKL